MASPLRKLKPLNKPPLSTCLNLRCLLSYSRSAAKEAKPAVAGVGGAAPSYSSSSTITAASTILSQSVEDKNDDVLPSSGTISRTLSEILKDLNKRVPDTLLRTRTEPDGFSIKYIPWHIVNRIMNTYAREWSGEVRNVTYSTDGKSVSVVYRVTLYGIDAEMHREATGTASVSEVGYGDAVSKAEAMAFRRACARFGLGLHLYHEDLS